MAASFQTRRNPIVSTFPSRHRRVRMIARMTIMGAALLVAAVPVQAFAWGDEGHEVVAAIARLYLTPEVRQTVDAMLASDTDELTAHDMLVESTWADQWRSHGHRETASWHFVDIELTSPDLKAACFGYPAPGQPASSGPEQDCVVDKVREFEAELSNPATAAPERLLALKYLLHFVGDMHQPLHSSDNHDKGGNCVRIALGDQPTSDQHTGNLHSYWDSAVVEALGTDPETLGETLRARITPAEKTQWEAGDPASWAMETFEVARTAAYTVGSPSGCDSDTAPITLPAGYAATARAAAAIQLERAGVRLALVLNRSLAAVK